MKKSSTSAIGLKKGQWLPEEDDKLVASISVHGVGRWNSLALSAGLQRTGKSCRLRWLNYLRPNVRHGGFTLEEQLLILQLHYRWGNRWAKIAEQLPGRTDNDIKNYWRTRVVKQAKRLNCDVNSPLFKQAIHHNWIPGIEERIKFGSGSSTTTPQDFRIPVDSTAEEHGDPEGGTLGSSSSFASEPVGPFEAQNMLDLNVNGRVIGPGPYERLDEQLMECALKDEDLEFLQHLLFGRTTL